MTQRNNYPVIGAGTLTVQSSGGDPVMLVARTSASACAVIAINYNNQDQSVTATTSCPSAAFDIVFGGSGTVAADASGTVAITVAPRTAVVYHATP